MSDWLRRRLVCVLVVEEVIEEEVGVVVGRLRRGLALVG